MDWKQDPNQWGAIHFHDDDVYDAGWEIDFALTIPADMESGFTPRAFAQAHHEEYIPFAVSPSPGKESKIALVLATSTYLAYGNDRLGMDGGGAELLNNILNVINPHEFFLNEHIRIWRVALRRPLGWQWHLLHVAVTSPGEYAAETPGHAWWVRPFETMGLAADTHIIDWLDAMGYDHDVLTDEELHDRGYQALAPYQVVIAGTHPEYCSTEMWDAYDAFRRRGGRIMALGGDGWYWRVAYHPNCPGLWSCGAPKAVCALGPRRLANTSKTSTGGWAACGFRLGKSPQSLVGVGFAAQGFDLSSYYERMPDSYRPEAAFIFEDVGDERIGDFGLIAGGAAGLEVDRAAS